MRTTQAYIEVAINPLESPPTVASGIASQEAFGSHTIMLEGQFERPVSDTLALVDSASVQETFTESVNDTISFSDTGEVLPPILASADNTLSFTDDLVLVGTPRTTQQYIEVAINPLELGPVEIDAIASQEAFGTPSINIEGQITVNANNTIAFTDEARVPVDIPVASSNAMALSDGVELKGAFRATQQYAMVLTSLVPAFRSTQQYVELLVNDPPPEKPENTLVFVDTAVGQVSTLFDGDANNTIVFSGVAVPNIEAQRPADNTLAFSQQLNVEYGLTVSDNLGITQAARDQRIFISLGDNLGLSDDSDQPVDRPRSASNTIASAQTATVLVGLSIPQSLADTMTLADTGDFSLDFGRTISDNVTFVDNASAIKEFGGLVFADNTLAIVQDVSVFTNLRDDLGFVQTAVGTTEFTGLVFFEQELQFVDFAAAENLAVQNISDDLGLAQTADGPRFFSITQDLNLTQSFVPRRPISQTLNLIQTAGVGTDRPITQDLSITDSVELEGDFLRSLSQTLFEDSVSVYVDRPGVTRKFTEFSDIPDNRLTTRSQLILEYGGNKVELRNPEIDDTHRLGFERVNYETSGGELIFAQCEGRNIIEESLLFTVTATKTAVLQELRAFMLNSLGQEITLHSWDAISWRGVITNPQESFVEDDEGYWTLTFTFVGERYDGLFNGQQFALSQDASATIA